ncbi:hypothetical protein OG311_31170 [Streptomyces sp. NBC_01343]|uniref:DUF7144 family membrane protein n=1 Tax=Streptomyces sp. NBC_01343 TaxID=2903832 RepID=UPI002E0DB1B9|nr:hypothetical protein OG311_31170 [Streptomyces sp. NBC_01343]
MASHSAGTQRTVTGGEFAVSGWVVFAAILMIFGGIMAIFEGIAAIAQDDVFAATRNFTFQWNLTGWGWLHLILGIVVTLAGFALFKGVTWARVVGIIVAGLSMLANFAWLPWYPFWAITLIILDAVIIAALCAAPRRDASA